MQFTNILALALATVALASPVEKRTDKDTPTNEVANQCNANQKLTCCNGRGGLLGLNCISLGLLTIPIGQTCSADNVVACCDVNQFGLINLNLACLPITIL
ncbi:Hydrophobin-like protein 2 [Elsinoe fawcettii]|nr:Hydrophobin-like protein 2 [Elsinoe fawcettii]